MKTVSRTLFSLSLCFGLSSAAYAQSVASEKPTADHVAKHKAPAAAADKRKPAAPAEIGAGAKVKAPDAAKPVQPMAAHKVKAESDKAAPVAGTPSHKAAVKAPAKTDVKTDAPVDAPKTLK
jgi:hypothetical protein